MNIKNLLRTISILFQTKAGFPVYLSYGSTSLRRLLNRKKYLEAVRSITQELDTAGSFSTRWFDGNVVEWQRIFELENFYSRPIHALEIGSWEGRSAVFLLQSLPAAELIAVDAWDECDKHKNNTIEIKFDRNVQNYNDRLKKYKGLSYSFFTSPLAKSTFDFIYIDGSHHADDVMCDAIKSFKLLKTGGIMIFDDYRWRHYPRIMDNPAGAINAFLQMKRGQYKILAVYYQLIIKKTI